MLLGTVLGACGGLLTRRGAVAGCLLGLSQRYAGRQRSLRRAPGVSWRRGRAVPGRGRRCHRGAGRRRWG
eukprot:2259683-Pyramimonas_sp.AAC.1